MSEPPQLTVSPPESVPSRRDSIAGGERQTLQFSDLKGLRRWLVDFGIIYLEWVLPHDKRFAVVIDPVEKSWVEQVLAEDKQPK